MSRPSSSLIAIALLLFSMALVASLAAEKAAAADRDVYFVKDLPPSVRAIAADFLRHGEYFERFANGGTNLAALLDGEVHWARADIDDDGVDEIFLSIRDGWCGSAGCETIIFKKFTTGWQPICEMYAGDVNFTMLDKKDGRYHELVLSKPVVGPPVYLKWIGDKCWVDDLTEQKLETEDWLEVRKKISEKSR
jgi:hypothetical protein